MEFNVGPSKFMGLFHGIVDELFNEAFARDIVNIFVEVFDELELSSNLNCGPFA